VVPSFLVSDYRKVGYANSWVRPPLELYNSVPFTNSDGMDASYRLRFGEFTNTLQTSYGSTEQKSPDGSKILVRNLWGIFSTTEYGPMTIHVGYLQTNLTVETLHHFFEVFRQFGPEGIAIADKYDCDGKQRSQLESLGASYDPGNWFLMGELARTIGRCFIGANTAWYISGGYRFGRFTPYFTYAQVKVDSNTSDSGLTVSALPPFLAGAAARLNAGLNAVLAATPAQKTISVGGRWDFMKNVDLKLQYEYIRLGDGSPRSLINIQPGFQPGGKVKVFSAVVDFVF
jgi:predicted porin